MKFTDILKKFNKLEETASQKNCKNCGVFQKTLKEGLCSKCEPKEVKESSLKKKCMSCGEQIIGQGKKTVKGDTICNSCDRYYAMGGSGELDEATNSPNEDEFVPTPECHSDCYKTMEHSRLCPHSKDLDEATETKHYSKMSIAGLKSSLQKIFNQKDGSNSGRFDELLEELNKRTGKSFKEIVKQLQANYEKSLSKFAPCVKCGGKIGDLHTDARDKNGDPTGGMICYGCSTKKSFREQADLYEETEMCEMCNEEPCACDFEPPLALLPEPTKQPINAAITATMDTATGKKQVTVTADGEGADELLKMLTNAGLNPHMIQPMAPVDEDIANAPNPRYTSSDVQLNKMSGGPNNPKGQYSKDRARDNAMSIDSLAESLKTQFVKESSAVFGNKTYKVTVNYDDPTGTGVATKQVTIKNVNSPSQAKDVAKKTKTKSLKNPKIGRAVEVK
jgi:hypothetical protein